MRLDPLSSEDVLNVVPKSPPPPRGRPPETRADRTANCKVNSFIASTGEYRQLQASQELSLHYLKQQGREKN